MEEASCARKALLLPVVSSFGRYTPSCWAAVSREAAIAASCVHLAAALNVGAVKACAFPAGSFAEDLDLLRLCPAALSAAMLEAG